jgi:hypothetical protein
MTDKHCLTTCLLFLLTFANIIEMLAHCKRVLEYGKSGEGIGLSIHPSFTKLITALRTAVENGEGSLDKEATSHDDLFDAFRLALTFWH